MKVQIGYLLILSHLIMIPFAFSQVQSCDAISTTVPLRSVEASAGFFANLRGSENSIRVQSDKILGDTFSSLSSAHPPALSCPKGCIIDDNPRIEFKAASKRYLEEYDDREKCEAYLRKTSAAPFTWRNGSFEGNEEFSERFSEFSQGNGKYGEELYSKCDGDCSPQYRIVITPHQGRPDNADVFVVCGPARDKDDALYTLKTSLIWSCRSLTQ